MKISLSNVAAGTVVLVFVALIVSGLLVPIYADEVSTKMTQATLWLNNWQLLTALPQCFSNLTIEVPVSWIPAALIYQVLYYETTPLLLRVSGVFMAMLYLAMTALGFRRLCQNSPLSTHIIVGFVAMLGLGVLPLTLVLSRSEQWLLVLLTYFVFYPLIRNSCTMDRTRSLFELFGFLVCTSLFFYAHAKAAFFFPLILVSAWIVFRDVLLPRMIALSFVVLALIQSVLTAKRVFECESAPIIAAEFAYQTISLANYASEPIALLHRFFYNVTSFPAKAVQFLVFREQYQSAWLPGLAGDKSLGFLGFLVNNFISGTFYIVYVIGMFLPLFVILMALMKRKVGNFHAIMFSVWLSLFAHLCFYVNWNFYAIVFVIGALFILISFSFIDFQPRRVLVVAGRSCLGLIFSVFVLSAYVLLTTITPRLVKNMSGGVQFGVPGQPSSVPIFHYGKQRDDIRRLAISCGISGDGSSRLVIDDLTYFSFDGLRQPLHLAYISDKASGQDIKDVDFIPFLNRLNSPGLIGRCSLFPDSARRGALEAGGYCCLGLK